jgi:hypothetical protein
MLLVAFAGCGVSSVQPTRTSRPASSNVDDCATAPDWLTPAIERGLAVPGATLGRVVTLPAPGLTGLPSDVSADDFVAPAWVAGVINGAGVRPQIGLWVVSQLGAESRAILVSANATAARYWRGPAGSGLGGDGQAAALACIGPVPEP